MSKDDNFNTTRERKRDSKKHKSEYQIYSSKHIRNVTTSSINSNNTNYSTKNINVKKNKKK